MSDLFEKATRMAIRFNTTAGQLTTEDLWSLPLTSTKGVSLNGIAMALYKQIKDSADIISFVDDTVNVNDELQMKFDIVKRVIEVRKAEAEDKAKAAAAKAQKEKIRELIAAKRDQSLQEKTLEELEAML